MSMDVNQISKFNLKLPNIISEIENEAKNYIKK